MNSVMTYRMLGLTATLLATALATATAQQDNERVRERDRTSVRTSTVTRRDAWDRAYASRIDTTVAFSRTGSIDLALDEGTIVVTTWNEERARVRATSDASDLRFDVSSTRLTLERNSGRGDEDARFELTVPRGVRVIVRGRSADVSISGTQGDCEVNTQNGDVILRDVGERIEVSSLNGDVTVDGSAGGVDLRSVSGDLVARGVHGDVEAQSVSGDISIREAASKYVRVQSTSGDVTYSGALDAAGRYSIESHSGDVRITVPQNTGAQLEVSTWSGSIESDFPMTLMPGEHGIGAGRAKRFEFQIGNGGARVSLESFSGDITIYSAGARPQDR